MNPAEVLESALRDVDERVRIAALMWAGESFQLELLPRLKAALSAGTVSPRLLDTYLASVENLDPRFVEAFQQRREPKSNRLERQAATDVVLDFVTSDAYRSPVRSLAVARLDSASCLREQRWLRQYVAAHDDPLALAIVRRCGALHELGKQWRDLLVKVSLNQERSTELRCEALLGLSHQSVVELDLLRPLLSDPTEDVAIETRRTLRSWNVQVRSPGEARPATMDQWQQRVRMGGSPTRGHRVFLNKRAQCSKCHTVGGRGRTLGPDLSRVRQSKSRRQIIDAVLNPSGEFPPQYQAWIVVTTAGQTHRGLQLDHKAGGAIELITEAGVKRRFESEEIESYDASPTSLMPTGLEQSLTVDEFRDLIAFLSAP